jgi:choline dehydrogenase-like flavoprotein
MEDIVIGSGPAGVSAAWALLRQGRQVTMLDVGEQQEEERSQLRDRLAASAPSEWRSTDIETYRQSRRERENDGVRPLGSDFLFRDPVGFFQDNQPGPSIGIRPSFARGGLSNGWGSSILPYRMEDIPDWPASASDLGEHYRALRQFMPMAGKSDDLEKLFPMLPMPEDTALPPGSQARMLLSRMERKKEILRQSGLHFGQARQAVGPDCRHCGMCLHGCPYGVIYNAAQTLDELLRHPGFSYQQHRYVTGLEEHNDMVRLQIRDLSSGQAISLNAQRVYVAAGVLSTTRLLMESLGFENTPITMKDSQQFFLPMLHSWRPAPDPSTEDTHSLVQLFVEIVDPGKSRKTAHVQLYTFNDLYAVDMRERFGPFARFSAPLINRLSKRLIVAQGFLHSDDSPEISLRLVRNDSKICLHMEEKSNPHTLSTIRWARNKMAGLAWKTGLVPLTALMRHGPAGSSFHCGATFPMKDHPGKMESDTLGRPGGLKRTFVVDASVLPSIPATTITLSVMANAHRIATQSSAVS